MQGSYKSHLLKIHWRESFTRFKNSRNWNPKKEDYAEAIRKLESAKSRYESAKKNYDTTAGQASESDIAEANRREEFLLDFLWIKNW